MWVLKLLKTKGTGFVVVNACVIIKWHVIVGVDK